VSEWIGWVSRLRRALYARMEELPFRTGTATIAGVLAVAATAILLTLIQVGYHAAPRSVLAGAAPRSSPVASPVYAYSPRATHRAHRHRADAPFGAYVPGPAKTPTAAPQASPSPSSPAPRRPPLRYPRGTASPGTAPGGGAGWPFPSQTAPFTWPTG
jgi:hypothetical protein